MSGGVLTVLSVTVGAVTTEPMFAEPVHTCPLCGRSGEPFQAVPLDDKNLRVLVRCEGCRHRWSAIVASESLSPETWTRLSRLANDGFPGSARR
jgi:hypothetical protein